MFGREAVFIIGERAISIIWRLILAVVLTIFATELLDGKKLTALLLYLLAIALFLMALMMLRWRSEPAHGQTANQSEGIQKLHQIEALLDVVTVGLFVLTPDGRITYANRAAKRFAGHHVRLSDAQGFGEHAAGILEQLSAGERRIVTLSDERVVLAWAGAFKLPNQPEHRLLSLQPIIGGLDAVQLGAWHSMIRVLSHEMMNSLTPITSLSTSLVATAKDGAFSSEIVMALETIAQRSEGLLRFIERYRAFAEVPVPQMRSIETQQFLDQVILLSSRSNSEVSLSIERSVATFSQTFEADPDLLTQALLNLLINAIDALDDRHDGAVSLQVENEGDAITFVVTDNGPGVPPGLMEDIFVPFFTTKEAGSGIGLSLARQVVIAHGGTLTCGHRPEGGMKFKITLPTHRPTQMSSQMDARQLPRRKTVENDR